MPKKQGRVKRKVSLDKACEDLFAALFWMMKSHCQMVAELGNVVMLPDLKVFAKKIEGALSTDTAIAAIGMAVDTILDEVADRGNVAVKIKKEADLVWKLQKVSGEATKRLKQIRKQMV